MEWLYLLAIGFICLAYPVILFISIWYMPWYIILTYFIWLISCLFSIIKLKKNKLKWYECILPSFIFAIIFTFIFSMSIDKNHYLFEDNSFIWILAPFLNLPAIYYLGAYLYEKIRSYEDKKRNLLINDLRHQIRQYEDEIWILKDKIHSKKSVMTFIDLLEYCNATNINELKNDKRINDILLISNLINEKQKLIDQSNNKIIEIQNNNLDVCKYWKEW